MENKQKIALISVHNDPNYGSMLQAYALSKVISDFGVDNEYIQYKSIVRNKLVYGIVQIIKFLIKKIGLEKEVKTEYSYWKTKSFKRQRELFSEFHKLIPVSKIIYSSKTIKEANLHYNKFIIGSDQLWSPLVTMNNSTLNFLEFVTDSTKKNAYAPSIGTVHIPEEYQKTLHKELLDFNYISCRERTNAIFLSNLLNKRVNYVLDPTLLLNKESWLHLAENYKMPEKYILCYILGTKDCISNYAQKLGKEKSLPVFYIVTRPEYLHYPNALLNISVGNFLSLINNATYVITDSFHGTIFSINFNTNFYCFAKRKPNGSVNDNDRLQEFLKIVKLEKRFKDDTDSSFLPDINFYEVNPIIEELRQSSTKFLKQIIS